MNDRILIREAFNGKVDVVKYFTKLTIKTREDYYKRELEKAKNQYPKDILMLVELKEIL